MIVKFFKYGSGDGKSAFNYLLNHRVKDGTSRILRGNADLTLSIIQSLATKKRYKSGCLSFEEKNISAKHKEEIMDLFEQIIFPSMDEENRNVCWIEHTDKGRLELNFVIPRVELSTGKAFNPYFHRVDRKRFEVFRDYINTKYGFTDPNDPRKSQTLKLGDISKYKKSEQIKRLDTYLLSLIKNNAIQNRDQLIAELKELGYEITRTGKEYISIKTKDTKAIRLKGKYYNENWDEKPSTSGNTPKLFKQLQEQIHKASIYIQKRFYKKELPEKPPKQSNVKTKTASGPIQYR